MRAQRSNPAGGSGLLRRGASRNDGETLVILSQTKAHLPSQRGTGTGRDVRLV
ncbi:MAG: hypothetical protein K2Q12_03935 [Rickettsiales bacterium]|nr:hypothetical protein [Rickettsiales bacterium]